MNALRAVPAPDDAESSVVARADLVEPVDQDAADDERAHEPATDPEALLLCALMWSAHTGGVSAEDRRITAILTADDFDDVTYRRIFVVIAGLVAAGEPYDPASVTAAFMRSGSGGAKDAPLRRSLNEVITAGADGFTATHYADIVLSQSYRRSYRTVAASIVQAAEEQTKATRGRSYDVTGAGAGGADRSTCSIISSSTGALNVHCGSA